MAQFGSELPLNESGGAIEWAVSFRFPVSWDCLSNSGDKVQARAAQPMAPAAFVRPATKAPEVQSPPAGAARVSVEPADPQLGAKTEWGIVVPKMARSAGRTGQSLLSTAAEEPALAAGGAGVVAGDAPSLPTPSFQAPSFQVPAFGTVAEPSWAGILRTATFGGKAPLLAAAAVGMAVLASVLWMRTKAPATPAQVAQSQAAPKVQQTSATEARVVAVPQAMSAATPSLAPIPAAKSEQLPAKAIAAAVSAPVTPTAARLVTLQRPGSSTDTPSAQSASQAALARASVVADAGEPTARTQAPIAARNAEPVQPAAAPVARPPAPPFPAPAAAPASTTVASAPAASALSAPEPQNPPLNPAPTPARVATPAPAPPAAAIKTGGQLQQAQLISRKAPVYPPLAERARVEGSVVLDATVGTDGRLKNIKVQQGHPLLQGAAVDAVKQWVYRPATLNGIVTETDTHLVVTFARAK